MRKFPRAKTNIISVLAFAACSAIVAIAPGAAESGAAASAPGALDVMAIAQDATLLSDDIVTWTVNRRASSAKDVAHGLTQLDPELECVAKVVLHEAANQPRVGQLAVAQIMVNRARSGRFPTTMCDVANQPGQFFNVTAFNPRRNSRQWRTAVEVAAEAMNGKADDVTQGAFFYHASSKAPNRFFQGRKRLVTVGDHIFYR